MALVKQIWHHSTMLSTCTTLMYKYVELASQMNSTLLFTPENKRKVESTSFNSYGYL